MVRLPLPTNDIDRTFGGKIDKLLPPWKEIPEDIEAGNHPFCEIVKTWFFEGLPEETEFKPVEGIDPKMALGHIASIMRSFGPTHRHKVAGCAYLFSIWFTDIIMPNVKRKEQNES